MAEKQTNKDRMREIVDSIENGIKELFESDKYRKYLATMSRFHRYSVNNTMLIYMQRPDATHVAGFNKWRDQFGRNVLKGEKGIRIIAPTPYKKKVEEIKTDPETNAPILDADGKAVIEEKEIRIPMFKVVSVFDVSQTAGKPLPQLAADLSGNVQQYEVFMEALRRASPVPMEIKPVARDTDGFFSIKAQSITIRAGMSEVQTVCAAVHEIAHAKLHDYEHMTELADDGETILVPGEKSRNTEEVEAESISYAVCQYYGIETGENSFGYIATWSKGKELKELRASLETINKTASELITDIDRHFAEICKERGINREEVSATQTDEALYLVDGSVYLHVQHTDGGWDYSLYDKESKKLLDAPGKLVFVNFPKDYVRIPVYIEQKHYMLVESGDKYYLLSEESSLQNRYVEFLKELDKLNQDYEKACQGYDTITDIHQKAARSEMLDQKFTKKNELVLEGIREFAGTEIAQNLIHEILFYCSGGTSLMMLLGEMGIVLTVYRGKT